MAEATLIVTAYVHDREDVDASIRTYRYIFECESEMQDILTQASNDCIDETKL